MTDELETVNFFNAIQEAAHLPCMADLGLPTLEMLQSDIGSNSDHEALLGLHIGTAYLRLSLLLDLAKFYCVQSDRQIEDLGFSAALLELGDAEKIRDVAQEIFETVVKIKPDFAEAHYNLGRTIQLRQNDDTDEMTALSHFERCLKVAPHKNSLPHAYLHANAHWERAGIFENAGQNDEALIEYRSALGLLPTFGVHHIRVARFMRQMGYHVEAAEHYRICCRYTHRYFPEFILPPLVSAPAPKSSSSYDAIFEDPTGTCTFFDKGQYVMVSGDKDCLSDQAALTEFFSGSSLDGTRSMIEKIFDRFLSSAKSNHDLKEVARADSIVGLLNSDSQNNTQTKVVR